MRSHQQLCPFLFQSIFQKGVKMKNIQRDTRGVYEQQAVRGVMRTSTWHSKNSSFPLTFERNFHVGVHFSSTTSTRKISHHMARTDFARNDDKDASLANRQFEWVGTCSSELWNVL